MRTRIIEKLERIWEDLENELEEMEDWRNGITWNKQNDRGLVRKLLKEIGFAYEVFAIKQGNPLDEVDWEEYVEETEK